MKEDNNNERALSPQEELFCQYYGDFESETCGDGTASAKRARYAEKSAHTAAWKLLRRPRVKQRLQQLYEASEYSKERIMSNLQQDRQRALAKDDIASAIRADELMLKRHGLLSDRLLFAAELPDRQLELDEAAREVAERAALACYDTRLLPDGSYAPLPPAMDLAAAHARQEQVLEGELRDDL